MPCVSLDCLLGGISVDVEDCDRRPLTSERTGHRPSESRPATSHDDNLVRVPRSTVVRRW
jgi:hypothetical protein